MVFLSGPGELGGERVLAPNDPAYITDNELVDILK
jgi:hypothetical protein